MKMCHSKKIALILTLVLMVPFFWNQSVAVVSAATPTFLQSKVEIVGGGEVYQLEIKNKVTGSTYKWSTSNTKVAKITSKGLITTVDKGTATVKCKITYPSKKTKILSCKVIVTIPATEINITNATEVNGAHRLTLGDSIRFEQELVPAKSSDKTYWSIGGGDADCIRIDDSGAGMITGTKAGKVILVASAVKSATKEEADKSIVNDAIIIEVVGPSATVGSAEIVGSTEIKVVFDSPVDKNTVIGLNNKLSDNIEVTMRKDTKGVLGEDPGALTASLSTDLKILTITSVNMFEGEYAINFTNKILTTAGVSIVPYYKQLSFVDNAPPTILNTDLDDTGMIATIRFSEAIDFTNFKVSNATVVSTTGATSGAEQTTISTLNNKLNYIISTDKKSLTINLSKIAPNDYGKVFSVIISGIKDMTGNSPANFTLIAYPRTDVAYKAQARPISVLRTSYNTISVTFDRAIQFGGYATIQSGSSLSGIVDANNNKKVNYTLTESDALLTGYKVVSIGYWSSYNVSPTDNYAQQMKDFNVDFTTDKTSPVLLTYEYDAVTSTLTLTYNKDVNLKASSSIFNSTLETITDDIKSGTNITFTQIAVTDNKKVIKLKMGNMTLLGDYTFTLEQGFAMDSYRNLSLNRPITISNTTGTAGELPGPYLIRQSTTNLSQIYVDFANKVDVPTAEIASNYSIPGVIVLSAEVKNNTPDNGATVLLTVADGSIDATVERPITIKGLKGYNGSYTAITAYSAMIELKDNKKPYYIDPVVFDKTTKNIIKLNFNEAIAGNLVVKVTTIGSPTPQEIVNTVTITGYSAFITLGSVPSNNTYLRIEIINNTITDLSGNAVAPMSATLGVMASY